MTDLSEQQAQSLQRYLANQVNTSSPVQRLLMLFDQLVRDLHCAELAFGTGDLKQISDNLVHAQEIVLALRDPLDHDSDLGKSLRGVYGFCLERLIQANLRKDCSLLPDVQGIVARIAQANRTAAAAMSGDLAAARAG